MGLIEVKPPKRIQKDGTEIPQDPFLLNTNYIVEAMRQPAATLHGIEYPDGYTLLILNTGDTTRINEGLDDLRRMHTQSN